MDCKDEAWELFKETGNIYAYMLYNDMQSVGGEDSVNAGKNRRADNTGDKRG